MHPTFLFQLLLSQAPYCKSKDNIEQIDTHYKTQYGLPFHEVHATTKL